MESPPLLVKGGSPGFKARSESRDTDPKALSVRAKRKLNVLKA